MVGFRFGNAPAVDRNTSNLLLDESMKMGVA